MLDCISILIIAITGYAAAILLSNGKESGPKPIVYALIPIALIAVVVFLIKPYAFSWRSRLISKLMTPLIVVASIGILFVSVDPVVDDFYRRSLAIVWATMIAAVVLFWKNPYRLEILTIIKYVLFGGLIAYVIKLWYNHRSSILTNLSLG